MRAASAKAKRPTRAATDANMLFVSLDRSLQVEKGECSTDCVGYECCAKRGFVVWKRIAQKELKERYIYHLQGENKNLTITNKRPCGPKRDDERKTKVRKERSKRSDKSTTERGQVMREGKSKGEREEEEEEG